MTVSKPEPILIAGAGLGGLTAAACLLKRGYAVRVFEQAPALGEVGAGIQISANATKVLHALGLAERMEDAGVKPLAFRFRLYSTGEVMQEMPLGNRHEQMFGAPYYHMHRQDLHAMLADTVRALDPDAVVLNAKAVGFEEDESGVTLNLADGRAVRGAMLVGADGIKSAIREQIRGPEAPDYTGQVAWRATVPAARLPEGYMDRVASLWAGPLKHIMIYYLRRGELLNFVGLTRSETWQEESWTLKAPWAELKADYAGWHADIQTIIDAMDRDQCYRWALNNRVPKRGWSTRRAVIMGDAAHATLPYLAQGAAMAIEDAMILARIVDEHGRLPVEKMLRMFEANRFERTAAVVNGSTANKGLYQAENDEKLRHGFATRDIGQERSAWLYSYDPLTVDLHETDEAANTDREDDTRVA